MSSNFLLGVNELPKENWVNYCPFELKQKLASNWVTFNLLGHSPTYFKSSKVTFCAKKGNFLVRPCKIHHGLCGALKFKVSLFHCEHKLPMTSLLWLVDSPLISYTIKENDFDLWKNKNKKICKTQLSMMQFFKNINNCL